MRFNYCYSHIHIFYALTNFSFKKSFWIWACRSYGLTIPVGLWRRWQSQLHGYWLKGYPLSCFLKQEDKNPYYRVFLSMLKTQLGRSGGPVQSTEATEACCLKFCISDLLTEMPCLRKQVLDFSGLCNSPLYFSAQVRCHQKPQEEEKPESVQNTCISSLSPTLSLSLPPSHSFSHFLSRIPRGSIQICSPNWLQGLSMLLLSLVCQDGLAALIAYSINNQLNVQD